MNVIMKANFLKKYQYTQKVCAVLLCLLLVGVFLLRETLAGVWHFKFGTWQADRYINKELSLFYNHMKANGVEVVALEFEGLGQFGRTLKSSEQAYKYYEGGAFKYFLITSAFNVCYVVTEKQGDKEIIIDVLRMVEVDFL